MRSVEKNANSNIFENCDQYEVCVDGNFIKHRCPFGRIFHEKLKNCKKGHCHKNGITNNTGKIAKDLKNLQFNFEKCVVRINSEKWGSRREHNLF